jgi:hypothetical protein
MKRILTLSAAVAAIALLGQFSSSSAQAQNFVGGYQFGAGINSFGGCGGCRGWGENWQREQQPYFATRPPVYYSHIVKRPYGVSPYAAPAGIAPIEMSIDAPDPANIHNPYFGQVIETPANPHFEQAIEAPVVATPTPAPQEQTFTNAKPKAEPKAKAKDPAKAPAKAKKAKPEKTTWIRNQYFDSAI